MKCKNNYIFPLFPYISIINYKNVLTYAKFIAHWSKATFYCNGEATIIIYYSYFSAFLLQYLSFHFNFDWCVFSLSICSCICYIQLTFQVLRILFISVTLCRIQTEVTNNHYTPVLQFVFYGHRSNILR